MREKHLEKWPKYPVIYEINTFVWLEELGRRHGSKISLGDVPEEEWDFLGSLGVDAVWLMGVWQRSPAGIAVARRNEGLMSEFRNALPDFRDEDLVGSAYCVRNYEVDGRIGGREGLAAARKRLAARNIRIILDFVPNHIAPDHPWALEHPEYLVQGSEDDLSRDSGSFSRAGNNVFALGRDPYFPAWPDVLQLNAFSQGMRRATAETLLDIAGQCDGVRCDMAMLVMNRIFGETWKSRAGKMPHKDFWEEIIPAVRASHREFKFIAECYWNLEWELQQQGFDFCYDKTLYDRMMHGPAEDVRKHLLGDISYQDRMIRFIENHDEPRAAAAFPREKEKMAALIVSSTPGAKLIHEGQFEGFRTKVPVFLGRRRHEEPDTDLMIFHYNLLKKAEAEAFRNGEWRLCELSGWPDNGSFANLLASCWQRNGERYLVVVNFSGDKSQAVVKIPWNDLSGKSWLLDDVISGGEYRRCGNELSGQGLYVDLEPWNCHFFRMESK